MSNPSDEISLKQNVGAASDPGDEVPSPCIQICAVDPDGVCIGCFRTLDEIACWSTASNREKELILHQTAIRKSRETDSQGNDSP